MRVAVVGVGLIGGSIGLAAARRLQAHITGYDLDPEVLARAQARQVIQDPALNVKQALAEAELVFVAVPVGALDDTLDEVLAAAPPDCVVTDVGSTKQAVVAAHSDQRFVGGHPLAGSETAGVEHAREDLFEGATWYLTPTSATSGLLYERLHRALVTFGARPAAIDPDTHDRLMASVSHLPHVLANVLVAQAAATLNEQDEAALPATGPSFRDATRVAGANGAIWTDIYLSNREALIAGIDDTIARLSAVRGSLADADASRVASWNDEARAHRAALLEAGRAGGPVHELIASVPNRPGVIADIALALGRGGINIEDMVLSPSQDFSRGVVALWVSGDDNAARAQQLIADLGIAVTRP